MMLVHLKPQSETPLHQQIVMRVWEQIENGSLPIGSVLPPTRTFAERHGVSRSTVSRAYDELWALGYIEGRPGSYSRVRERPKIVGVEGARTSSLLDWKALSGPGVEAVHSAFASFQPPPVTDSSSIIQFGRLDVDRRLVPAEDYRRSLNHVLYSQGPEALRYSAHAGYPPLREYLAQRLRTHSIAATPEQVLVTSGSQNGLDLVMRLLASPGQDVAVEAPTYALLIPLLRLHQVNIVCVPMREEGVDLEALEACFRKKRPVFFYTMPNFQNPTGITTTQAHREALLRLCERYQVPLIEDGFEEEMKYFGKVSLPIKSMDSRHIVIYTGTFSKVLMPGIRVGWITAHQDCIERLLAIKRFSDLSSNSVSQVAVYDYCRRGCYDLHLRRMHRAFRSRMQTTLKAARSYLRSEDLSWTEPCGGYLLWCRLKWSIPMKTFYQGLHAYGVSVSPGHLYFPEPPLEVCFRLSISTLSESEIEEGMRRLGAAITALRSSGRDEHVA